MSAVGHNVKKDLGWRNFFPTLGRLAVQLYYTGLYRERASDLVAYITTNNRIQQQYPVDRGPGVYSKN